MRIDPSHRPWSVRRHVLAIVVLIGVVVFPRLLVGGLAVAPARDAFRYWSAATCLRQYPFEQAVRLIDCQPLYPLTLAWIPGTGFESDPETGWRMSQVWSVACFVWLILAAYVVGLRVFSAPVVWMGCLFASVLPRQIRYSVDVLSDNLHAALWMTGLACLVWSWPRRRLHAPEEAVTREQLNEVVPAGGEAKLVARPVKTWSWYVGLALIGGVATGLAWWTRFEAILLPLGIVAWVACGMCLDRTCFRGWLAPAFGYLGVVALSICLYVGLRGDFSSRGTVHSVVATSGRVERVAGERSRLSMLDSVHHSPARESPRTPIDAWISGFGADQTLVRLMGSMGRVVWEFLQETRVWVGVLAALGIVFAFRDRSSDSRLFWLFGLLLSGCAMMAVLVHWRAGYLAGRYMMPVIPLVSLFAAVGFWAVWMQARRLSETALAHIREGARRRVFRLPVRLDAAWVGFVAVVAIGSSIPGWIERLHGDRQGHRAAAQWIATHVPAGEAVFDPSWVCGFFGERRLWHPLDSPIPECRYAVIEPVVAARPPAYLSRAVEHVARHGREVAVFPQRPGSDRIGVRVMELPAAPRTASLEGMGH